MERHGTPYISPRYEKEDYTKLCLTISSPLNDYDRAISIFSDRIEGRFLNQINQLSNDYDTNGFAIMALECLVVETLAQFREGRDNNNGVSRAEYVNFLMKPEFLNLDNHIANEFYSKIRCGILHQAQTKAGSILTYNKPEAVFYQNTILYVSIDRFKDKVIDYCNDYCNRIVNTAETDLRLNFIKKMDFLCYR